ncbi:MAG: DUF4153 domain-containing protein [Clostridium sp.]|uniref:DUF4153 domain-containing protein n=1 Tax=Clostridium sp. TaxID=1506 RepID=UPI003F3AA314
MCILLVKINEREILVKESGDFFEGYDEKDCVKALGEELEGEISFTNITLGERRAFKYYGTDEEVIVLNIEGFKVRENLEKFKILSLGRDKVKEKYGIIINEVFPVYKMYTGKKLKKYFIKDDNKTERIDNLVAMGISLMIVFFMFFGTGPDKERLWNYYGLWVTVISFIVGLYMFCFKKSKVKNYFGLFLFLAGLALSITYSIFTNPVFRMFNLVLVPALIIYGMKIMVLDKKKVFVSDFVFGVLRSTFVKPFYNFSLVKNPVEYLFSKISNDKKKTKDIFIGLLISVPVVIVIGIILFGASNIDIFGLSIFIGRIIENSGSFIVRFIVFVFCYIYLTGLFKGERINFERKAKVRKDKVNKTRLNTVLVMINLLYLLFTVIQLTSIKESYSSAAREVFFNLLLVMCINIGMMIKFEASIKKVTRILFSIMVLFSLGMGVNSIVNLKDYINEYGLTRLRFLSTAFSVFLIIALIIILINFFKDINGWENIIIVGVLLYVGLNFCNMDNIIAKYNINRIESGIEKSDSSLYYLSYLSKDAEGTIVEAINNGTFEKLDYPKEVTDEYTNGYEALKFRIEWENEHKINPKWFEYNYYNN